MNYSLDRDTGEVIDWEDFANKKYSLNFEDFRKMVIYINAAGRAMSALYYKHSDPDWSDQNFDAFIIYMNKLYKKYPEFKDCMSILREVGH